MPPALPSPSASPPSETDPKHSPASSIEHHNEEVQDLVGIGGHDDELEREGERSDEPLSESRPQPAEERQRARDASNQAKEYGDYIQQMEERVSFLEGKIRQIEGVEEPKRTKPGEKRAPAIPALHRVEWTEFKNKWAGEKQAYAIDVLVGGAKYHYQRVQEQYKKRARLAGNATVDESAPTSQGEKAAQPTDSHNDTPERIRINSRPILAIMGEIDAEDWAPEPTIILRPFKPLVYYNKRIREACTKLERKWGTIEQGKSLENVGKDAQRSEQGNGTPASSGHSDENGASGASKQNDHEAGLPAQVSNENPPPLVSLHPSFVCWKGESRVNIYIYM